MAKSLTEVCEIYLWKELYNILYDNTRQSFILLYRYLQVIMQPTWCKCDFIYFTCIFLAGIIMYLV